MKPVEFEIRKLRKLHVFTLEHWGTCRTCQIRPASLGFIFSKFFSKKWHHCHNSILNSNGRSLILKNDDFSVLGKNLVLLSPMLQPAQNSILPWWQNYELHWWAVPPVYDIYHRQGTTEDFTCSMVVFIKLCEQTTKYIYMKLRHLFENIYCIIF